MNVPPRCGPPPMRSTPVSSTAAADFLSYLNLWNYLEDSQAAMSSSKFRRQCKAEFLNFVRIREWQDLVGQLRSRSVRRASASSVRAGASTRR